MQCEQYQFGVRVDAGYELRNKSYSILRFLKKFCSYKRLFSFRSNSISIEKCCSNITSYISSTTFGFVNKTVCKTVKLIFIYLSMWTNARTQIKNQTIIPINPLKKDQIRKILWKRIKPRIFGVLNNFAAMGWNMWENP